MGEEMKSLLDGLNEAKAKIKKMRAEYLEEVKANFTKVAEEALFSKYEKLESFSWQQYTPYFNDGEACEFSVYNYDPVINGYQEDEWEDDDENEMFNYYKYASQEIYDNGFMENPDYDEKYEIELDTLKDEISDFIDIFDEADLKYLFGDHAEVVVSRKGVTVNNIDHD